MDISANEYGNSPFPAYDAAPPKAYNYDAATFELLDAEPCSLDPLETEIQGVPVWLTPANATLTPPEDESPGCKNVWNGNAWQLREDHRNTEYWLPGDTWQTPARMITNLGPLPAGAMLERPAKSPEEQMAELQQAFTAAVQDHLDAFARTRNYDTIMSAATYATSTNPRFATEGQYAVELRDAVWAKGYAILDDVLSGARTLPTIEDVLAELPVPAWPADAAGGAASAEGAGTGDAAGGAA